MRLQFDVGDVEIPSMFVKELCSAILSHLDLDISYLTEIISNLDIPIYIDGTSPINLESFENNDIVKFTISGCTLRTSRENVIKLLGLLPKSVLTRVISNGLLGS